MSITTLEGLTSGKYRVTMDHSRDTETGFIVDMGNRTVKATIIPAGHADSVDHDIIVEEGKVGGRFTYRAESLHIPFIRFIKGTITSIEKV